MGKKANWGILGCAAIAKARTIPGLLQAENANLYAVASRGKENAEEFQQMYSAEKAYDSYEALLADEKVEVVYSTSKFYAFRMGRKSSEGRKAYFM